MKSSIQKRILREWLDRGGLVKLTAMSWSTAIGARSQEKREAARRMRLWLDGELDKETLVDHMVLADLPKLPTGKIMIE